MKYLLTLLSIVSLLTVPVFSQSESAISAATKLVQPPGSPQIEEPISSVSRGIVDKYGRVILNGVDTTLKLYNTTNGYSYTITPPVPLSNVSLALPIGGGTLVATPTTLAWQFTGTTYNTVITQAQPTVGSTVINLPDTADVDTSLFLSTLTTNSLSAANSVWGVSNGLTFEGATADAFETTLSPVDPTADQTVSIANVGVANALMFTTLTTNTIDAANSLWFASNAIKLEGATADAFEITISPVDPTADATWSIPNFAVDAAFLGSTLTTNNVDAANSVWGISNGIRLEGATADTSETTVTLVDPTADRTITIPDASGTVQLFIAEDVTATNAIAAIENGSVFYLNSATEFVSTLPAPFLGGHFTFIVKAAPSGADYTIVTTTSANVIIGNQNSVAGDAGDFGTADDTISFVGGQSLAGDKVEVYSDGTSWFAYAISKVAAGVTFTQASP